MAKSLAMADMQLSPRPATTHAASPLNSTTGFHTTSRIAETPAFLFTIAMGAITTSAPCPTRIRARRTWEALQGITLNRTGAVETLGTEMLRRVESVKGGVIIYGCS